MNEVLIVKDKLDSLYNQVLNGRQDIFFDSDKLMIDILHLQSLVIEDNNEREFVNELIHSFVEKINLMYEILDVKKDNLLNLEYLEDEFSKLEIMKFNIENRYIMGIVRIDEVNMFKDALLCFRNMLYAIPINHENLLEIAKMKSKIQHFDTQILEEEDILDLAYKNSN